MSATEPRLIERSEDRESGRIAWITVDNQAKLNIVGAGLCQQLRDRARALASDAGLRALVITGAGGRAFIGGADIREMAALDPAGARAFITTVHEAAAALRALPVPVIARIQGWCLGAGLELAAACDLRVASLDSRFGMPEVRVGIPSVIEAALLPGLVGWGKARELVMTGRSYSAEQALAMGLIEQAVSAEALDSTVEALLDDILAAGPRAIRAQKALIREWEQRPLESAIQAGIDTFAASYESDEPKRLMTRFLERNR